MFVTSRRHPDSQISSDYLINLQDRNHDDIRQYIEKWLRLQDETAEKVQYIQELLQTRSKGLFLWLHLVIPRVRDCISKGLTRSAIQSEIMKCPQELDQLHEDLINHIGIEDLREAIQIFRWALFR